MVSKDLVLTALHRTVARGLPFLAGWNSGDRYAICHHAKRWDHLKKNDVISLKWAAIGAVNVSPAYQS